MLIDRQKEIEQCLDEMNIYDLYGANGAGLNRTAQKELFDIAKELLDAIKHLDNQD